MGSRRFEQHVNGNDRLFIPFITAGDPHPDVTIELALALEESGASALELGIPYSDPLADGPVIQKASSRALAQGMTLEKGIQLVPLMRQRGLTIPVIIFTYINPFMRLGEDRFFSLAKACGVDGLLIPDLPFEESGAVARRAAEEDIVFISLVAPTSKERIEMIAKAAKGFLYCVSSVGVTGVRDDFSKQAYDFISHVKENSPVPVAVGFGISRPEHVKRLRGKADGVIVGSAIIREIEKRTEALMNETTRSAAIAEIKAFVQNLVSS